MPRVAIQGFVGGSDASVSRNVNAERLVCGIIEGATGTPKAGAWMGYQPGTRKFSTIPGASSVRGLFAQDGRMFAVGGSSFVEVFEDGHVSAPITILESSQPATMVSNGQAGHQILALSGPDGIVYDLITNTQTPITAPGLTLPYSMVLFIDGYGIVVKANSIQFNFSNLEDFSTFDAIDVSQRSEGSDNISAMVRSHRELWMLGTITSEVWYDDGVTPFSPIQGVFIDQGCVAQFSALAVDNTVWWLGRDVHGQGIVYRANGYTPERVSTFGVETALRQSAQLENTIAWAFQQRGHTFYGLYVPDLPTTWVYDLSAKAWHEWGIWDSTACVYHPWFARCSCQAFGKTLIGDRTSGTIREVSFDYFDDEPV